jgi:hypothetical protein
VQHNRAVDPSPAEPTPTFPSPRWAREGYDAGDVDAFAAELARAVRHDPPAMDPCEVADQRFRVRRRGRRYDLRPVDAHLEEAQTALRARRGDGGPASPRERKPKDKPPSTWWIYLAGVVIAVAIVVLTLTRL